MHHRRSLEVLLVSLSFFLVAGVGGCRKAPLECGDERTPTGQQSSGIVGGVSTWDPDVVSLTDGQALAVGAILMDTGYAGWQAICTGTVVAPTLVLTAAHCVVDLYGDGSTYGASQFRFGVGDDTTSLRATLEPAEVIVDPYYNARSDGAAHDQAILRFDTPIPESVPGLVPIPILRDPLDPSLVGTMMQAVGFGCVETECTTPNTRRYWTPIEVADITYFDLTVDGRGVAGVCYGDSGGPALFDLPGLGVRVAGTLSWGEQSCAGLDHYEQTAYEKHFHQVWNPGCGDVPAEGRCEGSVLSRCEMDAIVTDDCAARGERCGADEAGVARCYDPCAGETLEGRCDGDDLVWCEAGTIKRRRCAECGLTCGYSSTTGRFECL